MLEIWLMLDWIDEKNLSIDSLRIDSTVVKSNIPDPMDSQMLNDGVRVLLPTLLQQAFLCPKRTAVWPIYRFDTDIGLKW